MSKYYYNDGSVSHRREWNDKVFHRLDGPAVEHNNGHMEWWVNGKRHREDGPAVIWSTGHKEWYVNGKRHRLDGPAVINYVIGYKEWWINDVWMPQDMFEEHLAHKKYLFAQELEKILTANLST